MSKLTGRRKYRKQFLTGKMILLVEESYTKRWRDATVEDMAARKVNGEFKLTS